MYKFKLDLKKKLLEGATDEALRAEYQAAVDEANDAIRNMQTDIGYQRRFVTSYVNNLKYLENSDREVKSGEEFERNNSELIDRKLQAEKAMDDALNAKANLEAEITTLEDL